MVKHGCDQPGHGALKFTVLWHSGANSGKPKVISMIFGWVWSKMGASI